eukprot:90318-Chlamydomonas_euryale.AAC.1
MPVTKRQKIGRRCHTEKRVQHKRRKGGVDMWRMACRVSASCPTPLARCILLIRCRPRPLCGIVIVEATSALRWELRRASMVTRFVAVDGQAVVVARCAALPLLRCMKGKRAGSQAG